jgi:predicted transcriptional regulator
MALDPSMRRISHSQADFVYILSLLDQYKYMGRYRLAQKLNISNAKTRTILNKLVKAELIEKSSKRQGHCLSLYGKKVWMKCQKFLLIPSKRIYLGPSYTIGKKDAPVCVEGTGIENLNTVVLRDEAFMNGALGCTVFLKIQSGIFYILDAIYPPLPKIALSDKKIKHKLSNITSDIPWSIMIIIVGTADHVINAQIGAISAALLLVPSEIKNYFQEL